MRHRLLSRLPKLGNRGNVALMTAIFAPLLLLVGGFAIDYGYSSYLGQRLAQATDNAVLASVSQSAATAGGGFGNTAWLQAYGNNVFKSNIADLPITGVKFNLQVTSNGNLGVNSVGSYTYDNPTFFAGIVGVSKISMKSTIKASANPITYLDYYILVDVSQSMGIGATDADMKALYARVISYGNQSNSEQGCVFGCHVLQGPQKYTNERLAHDTKFGTPISLRIDAAVSAIQGIISDAQNAAGVNKNIRIGLYMINRDPTNPGAYVTQVTSPSSDYTTLTSQAATIDLGANTSAGSGDSDFPNELAAFSQKYLPVNGSGASAVSPKNYVFLITDGATDVPGNCTYGHCMAAFDSSQCDQIKAKSSAMGVIYTTYITIYNNPNDTSSGYEDAYSKLVLPIVNNIPTSLNNCATSPNPGGWYFEAKDGPGLNAAMKSLFASTLQNARLTQ